MSLKCRSDACCSDARRSDACCQYYFYSNSKFPKWKVSMCVVLFRLLWVPNILMNTQNWIKFELNKILSGEALEFFWQTLKLKQKDLDYKNTKKTNIDKLYHYCTYTISNTVHRKLKTELQINQEYWMTAETTFLEEVWLCCYIWQGISETYRINQI